MGSLRDCTWILGLPDYRVVQMERQDDGRLVIEVERRGLRRFDCSGCGRRTGRVRDAKMRTWADVPWAEHLSGGALGPARPITGRSVDRRRLIRPIV